MTIQFDKEGHRGCRGLMPENTLPAFQKAIDMGVDTLEMDVVISKDNKVVVSHEAYFNSAITTLPDGGFIQKSDEKTYNLYQLNYEDIRAFDVGLKKYAAFPQQQKVEAYKPLLEEVIVFCESYVKEKKLKPVNYNIEIKSEEETDTVFHPIPSVFVDGVMNVITRLNVVNRVTLQSFDKRIIQYLHSSYPDVIIAFLYEGEEKKSLAEQIESLGFTPDKYSPEYILVDKDLVVECKEKGVKIVPWTVNTLEEMKALLDMGVDGLISDFPNLFKQLS